MTIATWNTSRCCAVSWLADGKLGHIHKNDHLAHVVEEKLLIYEEAIDYYGDL